MKGEWRDEEKNQRIQIEAADWVVRQDRGFTPAEQDKFLQWLAENPDHAKWFVNRREVWKNLSLLAEWRPEHGAEPNPDLLALPLRPRRSRKWLRPLTMAASFAVLFAAIAFWATRPQTAAIRARDAVIAADNGFLSRVLDDGSVVAMHGGAAISVAYSSDIRRVTLLRGEAHFSVTKNPLRPFIVSADGVDVRAVGTAFAVSVNDRTVSVLVTEGKVQVKRQLPLSQGQSEVVAAALVANQQAIVPLAKEPAQISEVSRAKMDHLLEWRPALLDFNSTPLAEVVTEFNRRGKTQLELGDETLGKVPIVASVRSDNVDGFVALLELSAGIRAERTGDRIILYRVP